MDIDFTSRTVEDRQSWLGFIASVPGAADLAAATDTPAIALGNHIWMSPGVSNSYAVTTDEGRVIVNAGLVFEGPLHRKAFADLAGPTRAIIVTQGHADHWGGVNSLRDDRTPTS